MNPGTPRALLVNFLSLMTACACGRRAVPPGDVSPPSAAPEAAPEAPDESAAARQAIIARARAEGHAEAAIHVDEAPAPLGTTRLTTRVDGAYPGAGMYTALVCDGLHYGLAGGRDLADFVRARRYFDAPPDPDALAELAVIGWLPGMGLDPDAPAPAVAKSGDGLVLTFGARPHFGDERAIVTVTIPRSGPAALTRTSRNPPPPVPVDARQALSQALASDDALALMAALRRADEIPAGPDRDALLAAAAVLPTEAIAFDALLRIGSSDAAAAALRKAAADIPTERRAMLLKRAAEAHGAEFVKKLSP